MDIRPVQELRRRWRFEAWQLGFCSPPLGNDSDSSLRVLLQHLSTCIPCHKDLCHPYYWYQRPGYLCCAKHILTLQLVSTQFEGTMRRLRRSQLKARRHTMQVQSLGVQGTRKGLLCDVPHLFHQSFKSVSLSAFFMPLLFSTLHYYTIQAQDQHLPIQDSTI